MTGTADSPARGEQAWVRRAVGTSAVMTGLTFLATAARELLIASSLGTSLAADAFYLGVVVPITAVGILGSVAQAVVIPAYIQAKAIGGTEAAAETADAAMSLLLLIGAAISIALAFAQPMLLQLLARREGEFEQMVSSTFWIVLPSVVVGVAAKGLSALLNCERRFALSAFAPSLVPLSGAIGIVAFETAPTLVLATFTTAGFVAQAGLLWLWLSRHGRVPTVHLRRPGHVGNGLIRQMGWLLPGVTLTALTAPIDQAMASSYGWGAVAMLNYANLVPSAVNGLVAAVLGGVLISLFSETIAGAEAPRARRVILRWAVVVALACGAVAAMVAVFAEEITRLLLERGAFSREDTRAAATLLRLGAVQMPFFAFGIVLARAINAAGERKAITLVALIGLVFKIGANTVLGAHLQVGGIVLATGMMYVLNSLLMSWWVFARKHAPVSGGEGLKREP